MRKSPHGGPRIDSEWKVSDDKLWEITTMKRFDKTVSTYATFYTVDNDSFLLHTHGDPRHLLVKEKIRVTEKKIFSLNMSRR